MINKLTSADREYLCLLGPDGILADDPPRVPILSDEKILSAFKLMLLARQADEWAVSLNRQGRMATYPPNKGQEANAVGAVLALREDDWLVPAFRELGALIAKGIPLHQIYLYWYGNEQGSKRIVLTFMGEGATSQGAVHEAFNLAAVWEVGVVFYVQNNQWAISLPTEKQTASRTLAEKACAYGFESIRVDGNDLLAVHAATALGTRIAREQGKPVLVEGYTYRLGAHTTADDPKLYRDETQVADWLQKDPLIRLEMYLKARGLLEDGDRDQLNTATLAEAKEAFERAEAEPDLCLEDTFRHTFSSIPPLLEQQLQRRLNA